MTLIAGEKPLPKKSRRPRKIITVNDKMQRGYRYELTAPAGKNFDPEFRPELTPREMLVLGVFGGAIAFGFVGLFIGPALLALAWNLVKTWLQLPPEAANEP